MERKNLYDQNIYQSCLARLETIPADASPQWGQMDAAQMFAHCASVLDVMNGQDLGKVPWYMKLLAPMIRGAVFGDRPYPKNSPTAPQYLQRSQKDFATEKAGLLTSLETFVTMDKDTALKIKHPLFGTSTLEERGWAMYKHLDHHLQQFSA